MEGEESVTPETAAPAESSGDDDVDDDELLRQLDEEFGQKRDDEPASKPKKEKADKPKAKPAPKDDDDDSEDEGDDEDGEEPESKPKPKAKPKAEDNESDDDDDDDDDEDEDDGKGKKAPKLHPKTPQEVVKLFQEKWREWRTTTQKRETEFNAKVAEFEQRRTQFDDWIKTKLGPAIQPAVRVLKAMEACKQGDWSQLRVVIEEGTGESLDVGTKKLVSGAKQTAAEKRLREELEAERRKREELEAKKTDEESRARQEQATKAYLAKLEDELEGHPVTKLKGFARRVLEVQKKSYDPRLKAFKLSPEEAANKVVKIERRRLAELKALEEDETPAPAPKGKKDERVFALSRESSREGGLPDEDESDEDILRDLDRQFARKRAEERKRGRR